MDDLGQSPYNILGPAFFTRGNSINKVGSVTRKSSVAGSQHTVGFSRQPSKPSNNTNKNLNFQARFELPEDKDGGFQHQGTGSFPIPLTTDNSLALVSTNSIMKKTKGRNEKLKNRAPIDLQAQKLAPVQKFKKTSEH